MSSWARDTRSGVETVKADEHVNDARVREADVVANGVELPVEGHRLFASAAAGKLGSASPVRLAAELVPLADLAGGPLKASRRLRFWR